MYSLGNRSKMEDGKYSVSWDDYRKSICNGLSGLQQREEFVDMTLAADGHHVKAHKMVLSLVSPYIRDLISSAECPHPIIFLSKVSHQTLQSILEYAYTGEVVVTNERLQEFLLACKELRIRGLEENNADLQSAQQTIISDTHIQQVSSNIEMKPQKVNLSAKSPSLDNDNDNYFASYDDVDLDNDSHSSFKGPVTKPTTNTNKPDTELKFTISNMGSAQIVLNRFLYNHRHTRKSGASVWKCINYTRPSVGQQRCPAFVVLRDNHVVKRACAHNHTFHDDRILRRIRARNMFTSMTEAQKTIEHQYNEIEQKSQTK